MKNITLVRIVLALAIAGGLAQRATLAAAEQKDSLEGVPEDLARELRLLSAQEESVRLDVAQKIGRRKAFPTQAVHFLGQRLLKEDALWKVQVEIVKALVASGDHAALEYLNEVVFHPANYHYVVVIDAARALGGVARKDDVTTVRLLDILLDENKDKEVRRAAAESIGRIGNMLGLRRAYIAAAEDPDPRVREECLRAVGRLNPGPADYALLLDNESESTRIRASQDLKRLAGRIGPEEMRYVCRAAVGSPFAQVRIACLDVLTTARKGICAAEVVSLVRYDTDEGVRHAAIKAVGSLGLSDAVNSLLFVLEFDKSVRLRTEAATVLGTLGDKRAYDMVYRAALADDSPDVRRAATEALKKLE